MPFLGNTSVRQAPITNRGAEVGGSVVQEVGTSQQVNPLLAAGGVALGSVIDLADTVSSSVPGVSSLIDAERGDLNRAFLRSVDMPGLTRFYQDYQGGIEVGSGIAGVIGSELISSRFTRPASVLMKGLRATPYLRRIALLDREYELAMDALKTATIQGAKTGRTGAAQYTAPSLVHTLRFDAAADSFAPVTRLMSRNDALKAAQRAGFNVGARNAVATEAVMALALNQNGFLFDDSMSYNLAFGALGVGLGGGLQRVMTGYRARKIANSDVVKRHYADATDPGGFERARTGFLGLGAKGGSELDAGDWLGGTVSDRATSFFVQAADLVEQPRNVQTLATDADLSLASTRESLAEQANKQGFDELDKLITKGISTDGRTRVGGSVPGVLNHLQMVIKRDPATLHGVEMLGAIPPNSGIDQLIESHAKRVSERIEETDQVIRDLELKIQQTGKDLSKKEMERLAQSQSLMRRLMFEDELTPSVLVDGEWMPITEARVFDQFEEPTIVPNRNKGDKTVWEAQTENQARGPTIDSEFNIFLPGKGPNRELNSADIYNVMRLYRAADQAVESMARSDEIFVLPENPNWFQLDMAEEILTRSDGAANVQFPGSMTRESAQVESIVQKAEALKKMKPDPDKMSEARLRFNLPRLTAYERGVLGTDEHPMDMVLRGITDYSASEVRKMSLQEVRGMVEQARRLGDLVPPRRGEKQSLKGHSFRFMKDEDGNPIKPLVGYFRNMTQKNWDKDDLAMRMAERKLRTIGVLTRNDAHPLNKQLTEALIGSDDFHLASQTAELMDIQIAGSLGGKAPNQSAFGAIKNALKPSEWMARDTPSLLAAQRIGDTTSRIMRQEMQRVIEKAFGGSLDQLANPRNAGTRLLLNKFHSFRSGWDLDAVPEQLEDGFFAFKLSDTAENARRWRDSGRKGDFTPGSYLEDIDGNTMVLDELGVQIQSAFNQVTEDLLQMKNGLLHSMGRGKITTQNHFVPAPNVEGKFIGFVMGPDNKVRPDYTVIADNEKAFEEATRRTMERLAAEGDKAAGFVFRTQDQIRQFATIWDRVEMSMINPGTTAAQPGKRGKGRTVGTEIRLNAFEESMRYLREQYMNHSSDLLEVLMKEQINSAKARSRIAATTARNANERHKFRSIHDHYLEMLTRTSKQHHEGAPFGQVTRPIERQLDKLLEEAMPAIMRTTSQVNGWLADHKIWDSSSEARKEFKTLTESLGKHMPFNSVNDLVESRAKGTTPPRVAELANQLNQVTAALILRIFEVAHPILNMSGMVNAMPAVTRFAQPLKGESTADYAARVGHAVTIFEGAGERIGTIDMVKLGSRALKRAWKAETHADYDFMVRRGYLSQEVAEFHRQFGVIESKGKYQRGLENIVNKASVLSDESENLSRSWGHMMGLEIAELQGIVNKEAKHRFAHDIANRMIANYDPQNRAEIFHGAIGTPLGLFQSFAINYFTRLFRYIETGDLKTLAVQYGTQTALFGATGLAGVQQLSDFVQRWSEDGNSVESGIHSRLPGTPGDILAHGLLSQIPTLAGLPEVNLYSRGDTSVRLPGVGGNQVPGQAVLDTIYQGILGGVKAFKSATQGTLTQTQVAEILSNAMVNRPLSGMIEQALAGGNDTDLYGQIVTDTQGAMEAVYRMAGVRSMRQSENVAAFYEDKAAMERKASRDEILRLSTRAALREGRVDKLPAIFEQYLENGGDERHFRRWYKDNIKAAVTPRTERKLLELLRNPDQNMERVLRLIDMGVQVDADAQAAEIDELYQYVDQLESDPRAGQ